MNYCQKYLSCLLGIAALLVGASPAFAAGAPNLGSAGTFAALAGGPAAGAVTCTTSNVTGDVGVVPIGTFVNTGCTITGTVNANATAAYADFLSAYAALAQTACDSVIGGNLAGQVLTPGVYCVDAASTTTNGVLTLAGPSTGIWIFKIGTSGTGALTGTGLSVVMANGSVGCNNVFWWVAQAATMTDSNFAGTILAGEAITLTRGTYNGDAFAKAAVTMTGANVTACALSGASNPPKLKCNQGVGNGPEGCDPGNSNQGNPFRSNDERGGTPGNPGRKGGNK